jgi:cellulose biosynthesis protein BcsQ
MRILTFYSYKGGTGRTMTLANVAWALANSGHSVLMIDWDLEAPGLPRYFSPFLDAAALASTPGLIEWLHAQVSGPPPARTHVPRMIDPAPTRPTAGLLDHALPVEWTFPFGGRLALITAGAQGPSYARRVNEFDWESFYSKHNGHEVVERLRGELRRYDYVLIDSRTGVTEIGGIATVQLPDTVVMCSTINRQSLQGAATIAESIDAQRREGTEPTVRIFPVLTRVESTELERLSIAREHFRHRFSQFLWHIPPEDRDAYWSVAEIPYVPAFAYEEVLCAFRDDAPDPGSMSWSTNQLVALLTGTTVHSVPATSHRAEVLAAFTRDPVAREFPSCFLSYSSKDDAFARKLHTDLTELGIQCWFAPHDLPIGAKIRQGLDAAINAHDKVLLILSKNSIASTWVEKEVETAFEREATAGETILLPLRVDDEVMTTGAAWAADIRRQRNIGDFVRWADDREYKSALDRLVTSLKPMG